MIASLPMYDTEPLRAANDVLWEGIGQELKNFGLQPPLRRSDMEFGCDSSNLDSLYFTQTCREPYRRCLAAHVTLVGTPDYGVSGCPPGYYNSVIVVRHLTGTSCKHSLDGATAAINHRVSWSGYRALMAFAKTANIEFSGHVYTGSHLRSAVAVLDGRADIAAIDAISFRYGIELEEGSPYKRLHQLAVTKPSPGLPFVARKNSNREIWFTAIRNAIWSLPDEVRGILAIRDLVWIPEDDYLAEN